jgi:hypothetical protein
MRSSWLNEWGNYGILPFSMRTWYKTSGPPADNFLAFISYVDAYREPAEGAVAVSGLSDNAV